MFWNFSCLNTSARVTSGEFTCTTEVAKLCTLAVRYRLFFGIYVGTSREKVLSSRAERLVGGVAQW